MSMFEIPPLTPPEEHFLGALVPEECVNSKHLIAVLFGDEVIDVLSTDTVSKPMVYPQGRYYVHACDTIDVQVGWVLESNTLKPKG